MPDAVELNLAQTADAVELNLAQNEITIEVVGQVGPRGLQGERGDQGEIGPVGPIGPIGPEGPPGTSSGFYRHNQAVASAQWVFTHDLSYPPSITTVDSAGTELFGDITYIDDFTIQIDFSYPIAGFAYCT